MTNRRPVVINSAGVDEELPASDTLNDNCLTANLAALGNLLGSANKSFYFTAAGAMALYDLTVFGRSLAGAADQLAGRTALGLGTAATRNTGTSGANVPLLSTGNTWSASQTVNSGGSAHVSVSLLRADQGVVGETDTGLLDIQTGTGAVRLFHNSSLGQRWIAIPRGAAAPQYQDGTALRTMWHSGNFDPSSKANLAGPSFTGVLTVGNAFQANSGSTGIEVGRIDGTAGIGYVDFHAGAVPTDYDARIQCTSGNGTAGQGAISINGGTVFLNASVGASRLQFAGVDKLATSATGITVSGQVESSLPTYNNLTLQSPYTWDAANDATDYHQPAYAKVDNVVRLRGRVTLSGTHTSNATVNVTTIATLPSGFRPAKRKAFQVFWDTDSPLFFAYCLVFVNTNGTIVLVTPASNQPYPFTEGHLPLDQIWFDLAN